MGGNMDAINIVLWVSAGGFLFCSAMDGTVPALLDLMRCVRHLALAAILRAVSVVFRVRRTDLAEASPVVYHDGI
jgi:hypothetical protein